MASVSRKHQSTNKAEIIMGPPVSKRKEEMRAVSLAFGMLFPEGYLPIPEACQSNEGSGQHFYTHS